MNKDRQPLAREILLHTSNSNQDIGQLSRYQYKALVLHPSGPDVVVVNTKDT